MWKRFPVDTTDTRIVLGFGNGGTCDRVVTWFGNPEREQERERGRHLSKGSTGAHGNNRCVMTPHGRAGVHERLSRDAAPFKPDTHFGFYWSLTASRCDKWLFSTCLSENSFLESLKLATRWLMWPTDISLRASVSEKPLYNSLVKGISDQGSVNLLRSLPDLSHKIRQPFSLSLSLFFVHAAASFIHTDHIDFKEAGTLTALPEDHNWHRITEVSRCHCPFALHNSIFIPRCH